MLDRLEKMKYVAVSVILGLAVTLASAASISPHLQEEWELFKVIKRRPVATKSCYLTKSFRKTDHSW